MKALHLEKVEEAKDFERIPADGYVCMITSVEDFPEKEYLRIEYDFAEGKFKDHWRDLYKSKAFWGGSFIKSYKEKALSFFKSFTTAVERSNSPYKFDDQKEKELVGKLVGLVLGEEEYLGNDGEVKTRLYVDRIHSVATIRKANFKVPQKKLLPDSLSYQEDDSFTESNISDSDIPF